MATGKHEIAYQSVFSRVCLEHSRRNQISLYVVEPFFYPALRVPTGAMAVAAGAGATGAMAVVGASTVRNPMCLFFSVHHGTCFNFFFLIVPLLIRFLGYHRDSSDKYVHGIADDNA